MGGDDGGTASEVHDIAGNDVERHRRVVPARRVEDRTSGVNPHALTNFSWPGAGDESRAGRIQILRLVACDLQLLPGQGVSTVYPLAPSIPWLP